MLNPKRTTVAASQSGFSLIELLVALTILGGFMSLAAPSFATWMQNMRIRSTAEAISAGLQLAKSEAVSRNSLVRFQLTSSLGSDCVLSTGGLNWVIDMVDAVAADDSVAGQCNVAPSDTVAPRLLHLRPSAEGSGSSAVNATASALVFNGLGKLSPTPQADTTINISNPSGGTCATSGGNMTCLRIVVSPAGQIRMCNPKFPAGDPQAC